MRLPSWIIAVAILSTAALAGWNPIRGESLGGTLDASCRQIAGQFGILTDWSHDVVDDEIRSESGETGAYWNGEEYLLCSPLPSLMSTNNLARHRYEYSTSIKRRINVHLTTATDASGAATPAQVGDPSWWWVPTVLIHDTMPRIYYWDDSEGILVDFPIQTVGSPYRHVFVQGTGGSYTPPPGGTLTAGVQTMPGGYAGGTFDVTTGPVTGSTRDVAFVDYEIFTSVNRESDNANVYEWRVWLASTLISKRM